MFDHIDDFLNWLMQRTNHKASLATMRQYLSDHGSPQDSLTCIHIAGTNGKGSTTNYLRSILQVGGYRVGTFTSPHLEFHQDRIRINDIPIDDTSMLAYGNRYRVQWEQQQLNMFEIDFFISLCYFKEHQVDFAIYEVGMGGRLDATNVIVPIASVITNIGMDHMQYLGDTLEKIAFEKAGIIKPGVPLFTAEKKQSCLDVFEATCKTNKSSLILTHPALIHSKRPIVFDCGAHPKIALGDVGIYQIENAGLVVTVLDHLCQQGMVQINEEAIRLGLQAIWKGRFEQMRDHPLTYVDGAHNEEGILALCETLRSFDQPKKIILAVLKDKPLERMLAHLIAVSEDITLTEFQYPRALSVSEYDGQIPVYKESSYLVAIDNALEQAKENQAMVVITGSLYFITLARDYLARKEH